jgi:large subunit ribosomal protein L21
MAKIAIIETGGKQYVVSQDSVLKIEKITSKTPRKVGDIIEFDKVLLTDDGTDTQIGAPYVAGAKVSAELIEEGRNQTVTVIKYRQKSRYFKKRGHRQPYLKVKITALS